MDQNQPITSKKVAYNIGFSDGLNRRAQSAYKDIMRWPIEGLQVKKRYYHGYQDAIRIKREVEIDNQVRLAI